MLDLSALDRQYSKESNNTLSIRHAKDLNSLLVMECTYNQDLPLRTSTVTTPHGWPCDIRTPYLPNLEHLRNGSQFTITGVDSHPSPAHGMTESQAESNPQELQIPSNSWHAAKPRADTNPSRTEVKPLVSQSYKLPTLANQLPSDSNEHMSFGHHECMCHVFKQGSREHGPVKISLYLITYYIGNVRPMTSVLWNRSAVHNCDAMPAQSWHDDLRDQTMTPGVNKTPASSDDCNATAGGASDEAPTLRPNGDATRHLGTREDSYQLLHKSNLGTKLIEEWHVSTMNTIALPVSLKTPFPTRREGQGTSKRYHAVKWYCHRLLGRQGPTLNSSTAQRATTTLSQKITTQALSDMRNALTASANHVTARSTKATVTRFRLQNDLDQPPSTWPNDALSVQQNDHTNSADSVRDHCATDATNSVLYGLHTLLLSSLRMTIRPPCNRIKHLINTDMLLASQHLYLSIHKPKNSPSITTPMDTIACCILDLVQWKICSTQLFDGWQLHEATAKMSAAFITSLFTCQEFLLPLTNLPASGQPVPFSKLAHFIAYALHHTHPASCITFASLFLPTTFHMVLQDNYNTAPRDASNSTKSMIHHKASTYQHFQNAADTQDTSETSSIASRWLMIDKDRGSITTSSQRILSSVSLEAEPNTELTSASIDVAARLSVHKSPALRDDCIFGISEDMSSDRTKLKRLSSLMSNPSWTLARHRDIQSLQSPPSLVSLDVKDARAAKADQEPSALTSPEQLVAIPPLQEATLCLQNISQQMTWRHKAIAHLHRLISASRLDKQFDYTTSWFISSIPCAISAFEWTSRPSYANELDHLVKTSRTRCYASTSYNAVAQSYIHESARLRDDSDASLSRDSKATHAESDPAHFSASRISLYSPHTTVYSHETNLDWISLHIDILVASLCLQVRKALSASYLFQRGRCRDCPSGLQWSGANTTAIRPLSRNTDLFSIGSSGKLPWCHGSFHFQWWPNMSSWVLSSLLINNWINLSS